LRQKLRCSSNATFHTNATEKTPPSDLTPLR
jgi:hypothetical protein